MRPEVESSNTRSLYGEDMLRFVEGYEAYQASAYETAHYLLTHGRRYPAELASAALGVFDRAAYDVLAAHREIAVSPAADTALIPLRMSVSTLGRVHIREEAAPPLPVPGIERVEVGVVNVPAALAQEIRERTAAALADEERHFARVLRDCTALHVRGEMPAVLQQVIDHVQHVESVCFYIGDTLYGLIDRYNNLLETPQNGRGLLTGLRGRPFEEWSRDEVLVVAALHALFLSGRAVRFEEFNGAVLTASALCTRLDALLREYRAAGCVCDFPPGGDLFEQARLIRSLSLQSEGASWLRYRWIYGLTFHKTERILHSTASTEDPHAHVAEFGADYEELVGPVPRGIGEAELFRRLADAALQRDRAGAPGYAPTETAATRIEALMEKIVASAVLATESDYGMSSSIRDLAAFLEPDEEALLRLVHALKPADFFTCFVSKGLIRLGEAASRTIADSVQRRMMFNRWHFIPGNFEREQISEARHWYYPPVLPDIAVHSDVHRAGHSRARVKFSIRAPGPDMSMPPLSIGGRPYRGFYDVRVVRMTGREYTTEEMLRTRRRTLWLSQVYAALVEYVTRHPGEHAPIAGFHPGKFVDLETATVYFEVPTEAG